MNPSCVRCPLEQARCGPFHLSYAGQQSWWIAHQWSPTLLHRGAHQPQGEGRAEKSSGTYPVELFPRPATTNSTLLVMEWFFFRPAQLTQPGESGFHPLHNHSLSRKSPEILFGHKTIVSGSRGFCSPPTGHSLSLTCGFFSDQQQLTFTFVPSVAFVASSQLQIVVFLFPIVVVKKKSTF